MNWKLIFDLLAVIGMLLTQLKPLNPFYDYIKKYGTRNLLARTAAFYNNPDSSLREATIYYTAVALSFGWTVITSLSAWLWGSDVAQNGLVIGMMGASAAIVLLIHLIEGIAGEGISAIIDNTKMYRALGKIVGIRARKWVQIPIIVFACVSILLMVIRCYLIVTMLPVAG